MSLADDLDRLWSTSDSPPDLVSWMNAVKDHGDASALLTALKLDQNRRWKSANRWLTEDYLSRLPLPTGPDWRFELAVGEFEARRDTAQPLSLADLSSRFPDLIERLKQKLVPDAVMDNPAQTVIAAPGQLSLTATYITARGIQVGQQGRYRLDRILGEGNFGRVYLAYDTELRRQVAVKVPKPERFKSAADADQYLNEARLVAALKHPQIVAVHDVGRTEDQSIYVVSQYIEGGTLEDLLKQQPPGVREAVEMIRDIALALHHAHLRRLIHRDVKPANILIDSESRKASVTDFGLAIREDEYLDHAEIAGTPAFMSPEQARGEGHRLDGRSDLFSLGVIFYQMLTGSRPFRGSTTLEILHEVISVDPPQPRFLKPDIPAELERICIKALAKRASDRYATTAAFAEDLQAWLQPQRGQAETRQRTVIKPKGLRSFDAADADFFLDLLPGTRDRHGLPESIAFWKQRIETRDSTETFAVGLIYGPSGCGKSSLVKAGLLPRLAPEIVAIHVEATPQETELRICSALRRRLPDLPADGGVVELLTAIRRNPGPKVAIFLDQFEQWLHGNPGSPDAPLVRALRQCDGNRLQTVLMIRDDFYVSVSRLMEQLDMPIVQRHNCAMVDLFDTAHAKSVLRKFGTAYGKLPEPPAELTPDQLQFLDASVAGLAEGDRVISVRLALFAEMIRSRDWGPATLQEIGGTSGVGVSFLEETFSNRHSDARYRVHTVAVRGVLKSLLPAIDTEIKGAMKSVQELRQAAGYANKPGEFNELLRILDGELRLITPTDAEGHGSQSRETTADARCYQLTHDYLVPSLRTWLTRKQAESPQGRAELLLEERTKVWQSRQEDRQLPSLPEYLRIRWYVKAGDWTETQRQLMRRAGRRHSLRSGTVTALVLAVFFGIQFVLASQRRTEFAASLASVNPGQLTERLQQADDFGAALDPLLRPQVQQADGADATPAERLAALASRLVLVRRDKTQVPILSEVLLSGELPYVAPIRERLQLYADELRPQWLQVLRDEQQPSSKRFRAALGLAGLAGNADTVKWTPADTKFIAAELSKSFAEYQPQLRDLLRPIADQLVPELDTLFDAESSTAEQQEKVTLALADYAGADGERMARLLTRANQQQTEILFPKVAEFKSGPVREGLLALTKEQPDENLGQLDRVRLGRRRANAAITLLRQGERDAYFDALRITDDPESLSQFVSRCKNWGVTARELVQSLGRSRVLRASATGDDRRVEARVMYGLLVALGSYSLEQIAEADREPLIADLKQLYVEDRSAAVHSASGWLLRTWGREADVLKLDEVEVPYDASGEREWFRLRVGVAAKSSGVLGGLGLPGPLQHHSLTFVVFPAGEYRLGSPEFEGGELDRQNDETPRTVKLSRPFALCDLEVTWGLYDAFDGGEWRTVVNKQMGWDLDAGAPACAVDWFETMEFCRWLTSEYRGEDDRWQCYRDPQLLQKDGNGNPRVGRLLVERGGFRLPTEAEWEVAARAGQRTAWTFGSDVRLLGDYGWFAENSGKRPRAAAVKPPGLGGLHDVQGNLFEWVHDWYRKLDGNSVVVDSQGADSGQSRVLRGGSWSLGAALCRLADRDSNDPSFRNSNYGFRLALSPSETSPEAEGAEEKQQAVD